jgi:hypothetical protein
MKNLFVFLFVVILTVLTSCQKEYDLVPVVVDFEAITLQLDNAPMPSLEKAEALDEQSLSLKSAEKYSIKIIPCDQKEYEFDQNRNIASRYLNYFKRSESGYLLNKLTLKENFNISADGIIDLNNSCLTLYKVGYGFKRDFYLEDSDNICRVEYFFRPEKGEQYSFFSDWRGFIEIASSLNGKWQIRVNYCDGQVFSSGLIDYYNQNEILKLRLDLEKEKVVSSINIDRLWIEGATNLILVGKNEDQRMNIPVLFDEELPERIIFSAPFDINYFMISGPEKYDRYFIRNAISVSISIADGSKMYRF